MDLGIKWVLRGKAIELESLRCTVSRQERVVDVRPTYALFSLETQSPKGHLNTCTTFGDVLLGFKFVVVNDKSYLAG